MTAAALMTFLIYLVIVLCLAALLNYVITQIPLPEPIGRIARIALVVITVLIIIVMLLQLAGLPPLIVAR